jgi:hypothetical protein
MKSHPDDRAVLHAALVTLADSGDTKRIEAVFAFLSLLHPPAAQDLEQLLVERGFAFVGSATMALIEYVETTPLSALRDEHFARLRYDLAVAGIAMPPPPVDAEPVDA